MAVSYKPDFGSSPNTPVSTVGGFHLGRHGRFGAIGISEQVENPIDFEPSRIGSNLAGNRRLGRLSRHAQIGLDLEVAELVVEHPEARRRYLKVHFADAVPFECKLADRDEPIAAVVAQLEPVDEQPIALEDQARNRVRVGHARGSDPEPAVVGFDETVHERRLERTGDAKVRAELPAQIRQLRRRRLQQRDVDGRALHREIDLTGSRGTAGPVRNRNRADGRQHRGDGLLETDVHIDRAPRVIRLARKGVEVDALDLATGDREVGLHERIGAGAANVGGRIQHARERSVAQHQLVDVLHLHVVEPHVEIVGTVRGLGAHRHRAGRCQALIAPQQHEIVERHRVVRRSAPSPPGPSASTTASGRR